jgi:hypothetical protein
LFEFLKRDILTHTCEREGGRKRGREGGREREREREREVFIYIYRERE